MRTHLIIAGLLVIILSFALAQDNPKKIEPIQPVTPIPEERKEGVRPELKPPIRVESTPESTPTLDKPVFGPIQSVSGLQEPLPQYTPMGLNPAGTVQPVDGMNYTVREFKDFTGGWNISAYKTKLAPNEALDLENALWNPEGEMYKRPGYSEHSTSPEVLNFLYRYYQQDGDKWTMGGSDTALYFWHEDSSGDGWTHLIGTEGTSGRWDGTTFDDLFVGTHEGIIPVIWDGDSLGVYLVSDIRDSATMESHSMYVTCYDSTEDCCRCSVFVQFDPSPGWDDNEYVDYTMEFNAHYQYGTGTDKNWKQKAFIIKNSSNEVTLNYWIIYNCQICSDICEFTCDSSHVATIFAETGIDTVWREGKIDEVRRGVDHNGDAAHGITRIKDSTFYWDSTFAYGDYIFEVTSGKGKDIYTYLCTYREIYRVWGLADGWDTTEFFVAGYSVNCFDTTTQYRIYKPTSITLGAKFVENFDSRLWLGWTGVGEEQEKNRLIFSEPADLGNWPPENNIWIESDDGDFITGMMTFEPEGTYRQTPYAELLVGKNQSLYRIFPYYMTGNELDYKTIQVSSGVGVCSNAGMANVEGRFVLFPDQHGVYAYDGKVSDKPISAKIDPVFEEWNFEGLENVSAIYNPQDRHYYISLPIKIDTVYNGDFITTFRRDSSAYNAQCVHWITTLDGEQNGDINVKKDTTSGYCDIASDTSGNYCILIKKTTDLYLMMFDHSNTQVGATIKVNDIDGVVSLSQVHVDMNNNGQIIVVWEDFRDSELFGTMDIYGQCLTFSSGKVGNNFPVNSNYEINSGNGSETPSVAINDDSVCIFVWRDWCDTTGFQSCTFAALDTFPITFTPLADTVVNNYFKPFGGWYWTGSVCILRQNGPQGNCANNWQFPDVDAGDSTFAIVSSTRPMDLPGIDQNIRYILMNYDLDTLYTGMVSQSEINGSGHPSISMNKKGRFVVAYHHLIGLTNFKIWARKYDVDGAASGSYFKVDNNTDPSSFSDLPDVAINEKDQYCIVWWDDRCGVYNGVYYRCYTWEDGAVSTEGILNDMCGEVLYSEPEITLGSTWVEYDTTKCSLAWNIDHGGWSKESFDASAYCYQHGLTDDVKILFADPEQTKVYRYATQADDIDQPVILTYQSPYSGFAEYPSYSYQMRFATLEAYLDGGTVYLDWYKDYSDLTYQDSITCWDDCREEMPLPDTLRGRNISMKLRTGLTTDNFTLTRFWWEGVLDPNRK